MSSKVRVRFAHSRTYAQYAFEGAVIPWAQLRERVMARHVCRGRKNGRAHEPYVLVACPPLRDADFVKRNSTLVLRRRPASARPPITYVKVPATSRTGGERWELIASS
jgi:hypothetical protein